MYQSLKNKIIKLNNSANLDDQVFESMNTMTLLKHGSESRDKFLSFYHSENRLVSNDRDGFFYKDFRDFLEKNI